MSDQEITLVEISELKPIQDDELRQRAEQGFAPISLPMLAVYKNEVAALVVLDMWKPPRALVLYELFVAKTFRNKGIGSRILEEVEEFAIKRGYSEIVLKPRPLDETRSQSELVQWYMRRGFSWSVTENNRLTKKIGDKC